MVVAFHAATLATGRALPLTRTGLSPVGTRQLSWRTKGRHFEASLILQAVSWYLRYPLSYRDIEELFFERGLAVTTGLRPRSRATGVGRWRRQLPPYRASG